MIHDSDASAMAELWFDPSISDASASIWNGARAVR